MKKTPLDPILTELEGYTGLGMKREALRLTRRILCQPAITTAQFYAAMITLLTMENRLKRWRKRVEESHTRLSVQGQRRMQHWMLSFHYSAHDYSAASRFIPKRFGSPNGLLALGFAWDIWTELGDEKSLEQHFKVMVAGTADADYPATRGALLASLGDYCIRKGRWEMAAECYREIPVESFNADQAVLGPLMALTGELLAACGTATETLNRFQNHFDPDLDSSLSNELSSDYRQIGRQINVLDAGLRRALGKKRLKELNQAKP